MNKSKILMRNTDGVLFIVYDDQAKDSKLVDKVISIVLASEDNKNLTVLKDYVPSEEESKKIVGLELRYLASEWINSNVAKGNQCNFEKSYEDLINNLLIGCENTKNILERKHSNILNVLSLASATMEDCFKTVLQGMAYSVDNELAEVIRQRTIYAKAKESIDKIKEDTATVKQYLNACMMAR
jgi:hypothetical protein